MPPIALPRISLIVLLGVPLVVLLGITPIALARIALTASPDFRHRTSRGHITQNRLNVGKRRGVVNRVAHSERVRLTVDVLKPIAWVGVIAQPLRTSASCLLFQSAEHVRKVVRIVPGVSHYVGAEDVRLLFILAAE